MTQLNFDASQVAPNSGSPDPVPAGWYSVMIDESEMKPTKDGTGAYLQLRFNIMEPAQYANRKVFTRLNLKNASAQAQEIAYGELSAICHSTGVMQLQDSQQLHGIPLKIKVKLRPASGDYEASNDVANYKNINEQVEMAGGGTGAQAGGPPAGFGGQQQQPAQQAQPWQQQPQQTQPAQQAQAQQPWQQTQQQPWQQTQQATQQQPAQQPSQQPQGQAQGQQPWQQPAQQQQTQQPAQQSQPQQQPQQNASQDTQGMPPWAMGNNQ